MMQNNKMLLGIFCCGSLAFAASQSFVIKKNKQPSAQVLRERCCDQLVETMSMSPASLAAIATLQEVSLELIPRMLDATYFANMDKKRLEKNAHIIEQLYERQKTINKLMQEQVAALQSLS